MQERAVQVKQVHVYLYVVGCKCIIVAPKEVHVMYIYICELVHVSIPSKNHLSTPGHQSYLYQNKYIYVKRNKMT